MSDTRHLTLQQLQMRIKESLDEAFPLPVWVTAEISELKENYSGHCYMELVEKGGDNQVPRAKCSAVVWRSTWGALSSYFSAATGSPLSKGMKVLLKVSVNYHELYGLSLTVSDIDPLYTLGDMERQRQETILRLQEEGVFDMNRSLDIPPVIQRIAVISSRNAAGYQDFMKELGRSPYAFEVTLFDAFMQGNEAEASIIAALERVAEESDRFDVAVVIRGGGSQSDLACFNSYRLCNHLAQFPLPVFTGIGHDKDQSVADLVAALALKTPTAVAAHLADGLAQFDAWLDSLYNEVTEQSVAILDQTRRTLQEHGFTLSRTATELTRSLELRLERLSGEVVRRSEALLTAGRMRTEGFRTLLAERARTQMAAQHRKIAMLESLVESRRPEKILALGFSVVRSKGKAVKNGATLKEGDPVRITFSRGEKDAVIR